MKILLIGEYSNVHWTLANGLRRLGHQVTVASSGDQFKGYCRDIDLTRKRLSAIGGVQYLLNTAWHFRQFRGYDVVQIVNPIFLDMKPQRILPFFRYLKRNNGKIFLGAFGDDHYWVQSCVEKRSLRYSEFDIPHRNEPLQKATELQCEWLHSPKAELNKLIACESDGIIACLYEYFVAYQPVFADKTTYIPAPINTDELQFVQRGKADKVRFFIGIQQARSQWKGTDVMLRALRNVARLHPQTCEVREVVSLPYAQYVQAMLQSDVLLDQLYSYSPAMNALTAMAQGLVVMSGGEPEIYDLLGETENRPIVNVLPSQGDVEQALKLIINQKEHLSDWSQQSRAFVQKHHCYTKVAQQYVDFWGK